MSEIMTKVGNPRCFQSFLRPGRARPGGHGGQQLLVDHDAKLVLILMLKFVDAVADVVDACRDICSSFLHQAWRRRKNYDPMAAAGKKKEVLDII